MRGMEASMSEPSDRHRDAQCIIVIRSIVVHRLMVLVHIVGCALGLGLRCCEHG